VARILIVDDEASILANLRRFLVLEGHEVIEAENGRVALEQVQSFRPELVLCDLMMPEVDGYSVLDALRANPDTDLIPFVFLTASAEKKEQEECFARGANGYLAKPFSLAELTELVNRLLSDDQS